MLDGGLRRPHLASRQKRIPLERHEQLAAIGGVRRRSGPSRDRKYLSICRTTVTAASFGSSGGGRMATSTTKDRVLDIVQQLPPNATVEQAMERLYFLAKVEEGLRQADAGKLVSHEDAKRRLLG